jgi:hypothetical protein
MKRSLPLRPEGSHPDGNESGIPLPSLCPDCHHPLDFHQPDLSLPNRLLGICESCRAWLLLDIDEDGHLKSTRLPAPPEFRLGK